MDAPILCPHCGEGFTVDPASVRTAWVVCPHCRSVVDPAADAPPQPTQPRRPALAPRRPDRTTRGLGVVAAAVGVLLVGYFGWWYYRDHYPDFQPYTAPDGGYRVSFPAPPEWRRGEYSYFGPRGAAVRPWGADAHESYVVYSEPSQCVGSGDAAAQAALDRFCWRSRYDLWLLDRSTPLVLHGCAAIDFSLKPGTTVTISGGRVVVVREQVYFLLVGGPDLSPTDARARRFLNSFHHRSW